MGKWSKGGGVSCDEVTFGLYVFSDIQYEKPDNNNHELRSLWRVELFQMKSVYLKLLWSLIS